MGVIGLIETQVTPFQRQTDPHSSRPSLTGGSRDRDYVRLFEAEQERSRELTESLEYQTATGDILRVISRSPTDVQPIF